MDRLPKRKVTVAELLDKSSVKELLDDVYERLEDIEEIAIILGYDNKIEWFFRNESFPYYIDISKGNNIPQNTVASEYFIYGRTEELPQDINPYDWNINADNANDFKFYEQCIYAKNYGYILSFISVGK